MRYVPEGLRSVLAFFFFPLIKNSCFFYTNLKKGALADIHAHNLTIELKFLFHNSKILSNYTYLSLGD